MSLAEFFAVSLLLLQAIGNGDESAQLDLFTQSGEKIEISATQCAYGVYFPAPIRLNCACITGIWAFFSAWCSAPVLVVGGINHCFTLTHIKVNFLTLLSSPTSSSTPFVARLTSKMDVLKNASFGSDSRVYWNPKRSSFLTFGESEWELIDPFGESRCLKTVSNFSSSFCMFSKLGTEKITQIRTPCRSKDSVDISPDSCSEFVHGTSNDANICEKMKLDLLSRRVFLKQQVPNFGNQTQDNETSVTRTVRSDDNLSQESIMAQNNTLAKALLSRSDELKENSVTAETTIEDDLDLDEVAPPIVPSSPIILDHLSSRVENEIEALIGNRNVTKSGQDWPVIQLLEASLDILKRTCPRVMPNYLDMALMTFVDAQIHSLHIKEPFVDPTAFSRIHKALLNCFKNATPHNFISDLESPKWAETSSEKEECSYKRSVSDIVEKNGVKYKLRMPIDRRGGGFEPVVETVWKMLVNAHSYCYRFFSDYYNDHHSYTVGLFPLFTNEIQEIWMPPSYGGGFIDPELGCHLYGGLIGDHREMLRKVDMCAAASSVGSPYPWHMNRPPRDKSGQWQIRRKRSSVAENPTQYRCIQAFQDFESILKLPKCD